MKQKIAAIVAAVAIWATGAYPPWRESFCAKDRPCVSTPAGNDWLLNEKIFKGYRSYAVDFGRLAVEWAIIAALYGASVVVLRAAPAAPAKE